MVTIRIKRVRLSMGIRLAIVVSLFVTVIHAAGAFYFARVQAAKESESVQRLMMTTSKLEAKTLADRMNRLMVGTERSARHVQSILKYDPSPNREMVNEMLRESFEKDPDLSGAWVVFEENAFDGQDVKFVNAPGHDKTGRFVTWWHTLESDKPKLEPCLNYDQSDYYLIPKRNLRPTLLSPYYYELMSGRGEWFVSAVTPVIVGGVFRGVVGMDCALRDLRERVGAARVLGKGFGTLVSPEGTYAAHPNARLVGKRVEDPSLNRPPPGVEPGGTWKALQWSEFLRAQAYVVFVPVRITAVKEHWLFRFVLPAEVTQEASVAQRDATLLANGLMLIPLVLGIAWFLSSRLRPVSRIARQLAEVSTGDIDAVTTLPVATRDEVGLLTTSYNNMIENVRDRLRADADRARLVNSLVNAFVYRHDVDGMLLYLSQSAERVFGYTVDEIKGHYSQFLSDDPVNDEVAVFTEELIRTGRQQVYEVEIVRKDGGKRWLNLSESPVVDESGRVVAVEGIAHDITTRKKAEKELQRFGLVIEQTTEAVVITDLDAKITYVNPAFEKVTGYTRSEVLGQNPGILQSGQTEASVYRELWDTITTGGVWAGRFINKAKNGDIFIEDARVSPLLSPAGQPLGYVATKRNITRELYLEAQFHQAQKMEAIGQLAGGIAHDFNNVLASIVGFSEMAIEELQGNERLVRYMENILKASHRAKNLVTQILTFSRRSPQKMAPTHLQPLIQEVADLFRASIPSTVLFSMQLEKDTWPVLADATKVHEVLMNLATNAVHAMDEKGELTIFHKEITTKEPRPGIMGPIPPGFYSVVEVKDTGEGMDKSVLSQAFEPFYTTKEAGSGTGLGLSVVYGIMQSHGGNIQVDTTLGLGTSFRLFFPKTEYRKTAEEKVKLGIKSGSEKVLFVDDEELICEMSKEMIGSLGYQVTTTSSGEVALKLIEESPDDYDILIADQTMPRISGLELIRKARNRCPDLPVILCTGFSSKVNEETAANFGVTVFIAKPFTKREIAIKIREALDGTISL